MGWVADVRPVRLEDARDLARVHVASWRTTYAGIVDPNVLAGLREDDREREWQTWLSSGASFAYAADTGDEIVGFGIAGSARDAHLGVQGEIYALYLLRAWQGHGLGRALMTTLFDKLQSAGVRSAYTWVFADNAPARAFYAGLGGAEGPEQSFDIGPRTHREITYLWPMLPNRFNRQE